MQQANNQNQFLLCINNKEYQASLQIQKIYQVIFDFKASQHQMIRVIDESGELPTFFLRLVQLALIRPSLSTYYNAHSLL